MGAQRSLGVLFVLLMATLGCASTQPAPQGSAPTVLQAQSEIPEERLLDVSIEVFDPGLPEEALEIAELEEKGVFQEVRKSEARYFALQLKDTLESTGNWGAVRVVPAGTSSAEVTVAGQIVKSNGKELALDIRVMDTSGRVWLERRYKQPADLQAYAEDQLEARDPYHLLYTRVANDMLEDQQRLSSQELMELRRISELRFAADLAPMAFEEYISTGRRGRIEVEHLPAADDPIMQRVVEIRERDYMFVDTLNEHYANFALQMEEPYDQWRAFSYEEQIALEELRRAARMRKILGALAIIGALVADVDNSAEAVARDAAVLGGMAAIQSGISKSQEAKIHVEALRELGGSFDAEVAPLVVEVEGQTLRLSGSLETQYANWRDLLREIYRTETGFPVDPNTGGELAFEELEEN